MRHVELGLASLLLALALAGCVGGPQVPTDTDGIGTPLETPHTVLASLGDGTDLPVSEALGEVHKLLGTIHMVGQPGAEPSLGVTSKGTIFFQAFEKTMRSRDHGMTWERTSGLLTATGTSDPYLWVDPTTDRVFQVNMGLPGGGGRGVPSGGLVCSHIAWSDDEGANWLGNPFDCGPIPVNDHMKLATGPFAGPAANAPHPLYPNAVYYAYNKLAAAMMAVSLDGGATFPYVTPMYTAGCNGSLHGAITTAPDGTVYVPGRYCPGPIVAYSYDGGLTWSSIVVGAEAGVPEQQKNPEIAVDSKNNAYLTWVGKDNRLHLATSGDRAKSWSKAVQVTPNAIGSVIFPTIIAGDEGRIGLAYYATDDSNKGPWEVDNATQWHLYYTYSLNALDANPTFITIQLTPEGDPIQRGTLCVGSGQCKYGNRNLLDFIDLVIDADGRPYVAYADGCTSEQCLKPDAKPSDSRQRDGAVAILQAGPGLVDEKGILEPLG